MGGAANGPFANVQLWHSSVGREPWVVFNPQPVPIETPFGFSWPPKKVCLHPGEKGEFSMARWTAPKSGRCAVRARFTGLPSTPATTDVHILHNRKELLNSSINLDG